MNPEAYDIARTVIERLGFSPPIQTKLSLFLCAAKNTNALFLAAAEMQPFTTVAHQFLHAQYFQEVEAVVLLAKVTRWVADPSLYARAAAVTAPIWADWVPLVPGWSLESRGFYRGLALGHALLSGIRLTPIIPAGADEGDPFVVALRRIEQDNARMLQTQIRLLKTAAHDLSLDERERVIEEKQEAVDRSFANLLAWIAQTANA